MSKPRVSSDGRLAAEIQRKTAEIDDWPAWAKPYEHRVTASEDPAPAVVRPAEACEFQKPEEERS